MNNTSIIRKSSQDDYTDRHHLHQCSSSQMNILQKKFIDMKLDRKSVARGQLIKTLNMFSSQQIGVPPGKERYKERTSFPAFRGLLSSSGEASLIREQLTFEKIHHEKPARIQQNRVHHFPHKTRDIDWNNFILELHKGQHNRRLHNLNGSLSASSDLTINTSTHGINSKQISYTKIDNSNQNNVKRELSAQTTYRPLTPKLLKELDKKKMPPKKYTQLWVNQLPLQFNVHNIPVICVSDGKSQ